VSSRTFPNFSTGTVERVSQPERVVLAARCGDRDAGAIEIGERLTGISSFFADPYRYFWP
jgi:hypothetical protein